MIEFFVSKPELFWFILGLILLLLELVMPGFVIIFFGIGAWATALLCLVADPGFNLQAIIFASTSVLSLIALRKMLQKRFFYTDSKLSESVEDEFTGKEAVAVTSIDAGGTGKVEFKGTTWRAESDAAINEGQRVVIKKIENVKLIVEPKK